jgi:hypothetical protein
MTMIYRQRFALMLFVMAVLPAGPLSAGEWTDPVEVRHDTKTVLSYRAKWDGDLLVVRAAIQPGWHTFAMDNKRRQQEKLAGKPSLGIEKSTEISVEGLSVAGPWLQSPPKDLSKPEIRWFTWGFEDDAIFAAKARPAGTGPARVELRGQACAGEICKNIDVSMTVPLAGEKLSRSETVDVKSLVQVR